MNYRLKLDSGIIYEVFRDNHFKKFRLRIVVQPRGNGMFFESMDLYNQAGECNIVAQVIDKLIIEKDFTIVPIAKNGSSKILIQIGKYQFVNPRLFNKIGNLERSIVKLNDILFEATQ